MPSVVAMDVITHEFGHFAYWMLSYVDVNEWNSLWETYKADDIHASISPSTRYSFKNAAEGFSEAFAAVEGFKYMSVTRSDPLFHGCKELLRKYRSEDW
jgi:hypothetical protein